MRKTRHIVIVFCLITSIAIAQQDPLASQYHLNPAMINPAYSGLYNSFMINANSRLQWTGLQGNPFSNFVTATTSILEKRVGGGILINQDNIGVTSTLEMAMMYAYRIEMDNETLSLGLQGGVINLKQNLSDLNLRYPDDPDFPHETQTAMKTNFGAGAALMGERYFVGLSVPRIRNVKFDDGIKSSAIYRRHYYGSFAFIMDVTSFVKLKPSALIRYVEGSPVSYDLGANILWNHKFWAGVYTRNLTTQGALFQLIVNQTIRMGYAIEIPTSKFTAARFITHELVLGIDLSLFKNQEAFLRYF